jgi:hypothetical protein
MDEQTVEKFKKLAQELKASVTNPDLEIDICFEGVEVSEGCEPGKFPYVRVTYTTNEHNVHRKDIEISPDNWSKDVGELKDYITFQIEQFMEEIDSVEYSGE